MPHVLVAGRIHPVGLDLLRATAGVTVEAIDEVSTASFAPFLPRADALLIRTQPLPGNVIADAARLKIVSRHGVGYDTIDVPALDAKGIALAIVGDVNSRPVAEHAFSLMLALVKRTTFYDAATRNGDWNVRNSFSAAELWGKRLFLVGFGRIGRIVAGMATAFGMVIIAYDPFLSPEQIRAAGAEPVSSIPEGLRGADIVSLHVPKASDGFLIGATELALMRPTALLINTARGDLVDGDALADALDAGALAGAGLDVFSAEPPDRDTRLLAAQNTVLSPHTAALTRECAARMSEAAARNILDFFTGRLSPELIVNKPVQ